MKKQNNFVFKVMIIVAWIIFVGLSIEAGGLLVNFIYSLFKPEVVKHLYNKLDLSEMYNRSKEVFVMIYSFILVIAILKSILFYKVIQLASKLDLAKPFSSYVSSKIMTICYFTLSIGLLSYVAKEVVQKLLDLGYKIDQLNPYWVDSQAFILMSAVIYIIATIFKRGIEIQTENDSTI
jgi:hypothetical protein